MPGYQWKVFDSADELEQFVEAGGDGGFLLTGKFTYTYVVRDRSLLDSQDSEFSEIYTSYWQEKELEEAGVAASKVQEILDREASPRRRSLEKTEPAITGIHTSSFLSCTFW